MAITWISIPAVFAVQIGFAGLLGALTRQVQVRQARAARLAAMLLTAALLVTASYVLPMSGGMKAATFGASVLAAILTAWKLDWLSQNEDWVWLYIAMAMSLILVWSIAQSEPLLSVAISLAAGLAALLAARRGMLARAA
jgi:hypothetical protein